MTAFFHEYQFMASCSVLQLSFFLWTGYNIIFIMQSLVCFYHITSQSSVFKYWIPRMLMRPDLTRPRPRPEDPRPRPRPNHRGRGRKVYRYRRVNDRCNYETYFGYVTARTQLSGKNIILNDTPSPRPNIMQVVNESMCLKKVSQAVGPRPWPYSTRG